MTAISRAAEALTSAYDRLERASAQLLGAVDGADEDADAGAAIADMLTAKADVKAAVTIIRFSDEMWSALLSINRR